MIADEMLAMQEETQAADDLRDSLFRMTRNVIKNTGKIQFAVRTGGQGSAVNNLVEENTRIINELLVATGGDSMQRSGQLSQAITTFTETRMMQHFFDTGALAAPSLLQPCDDEEYVGAALGFSQELSRYAVGRACENDTTSIEMCRNLIMQVSAPTTPPALPLSRSLRLDKIIQTMPLILSTNPYPRSPALTPQLNVKMLEFDFRNGPLRRKYDGLKYALKNLEDITYELSLLEDRGIGIDAGPADSDKMDEGGDAAGPTAKRPRTGTATLSDDPPEEALDLLAADEIDAIKGRMDAFDKLREQVIKDSRDVQKLAKQAIFAVHRGNLKGSKAQLDDALGKATAIQQLIEAQPSLRGGSFSNSLEEWAEGVLTLEWALNKRVMSKKEMPICNTAEYVGALSDFTGEIGRLAIASASKRDFGAVRQVHQADVAISAGLMQVNVGGKYTKKVDAVSTNLRKVEDVVYELSMLKRGGKGKPMEQQPKEEKGGDEE